MQYANIGLLVQNYVLNNKRLFDNTRSSWISQATFANQKLVVQKRSATADGRLKSPT